MKEATGELNMTVITVIAIAAIGAILWALWPSIQQSIENAWGAGTKSCPQGKFVDQPTNACK